MRIKALATDRMMDLIVADRLQFRRGRVVEFRQFVDSSDATELWLTREIAESKSAVTRAPGTWCPQTISRKAASRYFRF
jgi:hypothetical protein